MAEGVRSLERAFDLLEHLADAGGEMALSELTDASGLPMPTIYRLMQTLVAKGYVRQEPSKRYALGPRLIRLGDSAGRLLRVNMTTGKCWAQAWRPEDMREYLCLLYTSPSPRDGLLSRMPSSA